jgi:hypothetical protein
MQRLTFSRSRQRKLVLVSLVAIPLGTYAFLKYRQAENKKEALKLEEEGRRNWIQSENQKEKNYQVHVGRSGGGI